MTQVPFTPEGVTQKTTELYALPDAELQQQANLVRSDFKSWMQENFQLTTSQITYLNGIHAHVVRYLSCKTAIAMENRLSIRLTVSGEDDGTGGKSKLIRDYDETTVTYSETGSSAITGTLDFEISYV